MNDGRKRPSLPQPPQTAASTSPPGGGGGFDALSDEDKEAIRERAIAAVAAERRKAAEDALYKEYLAEERGVHNPQEQIMGILLDLAPYAKSILIDGKEYFHGFYYEVPKSKFDVFAEMVARTWSHDQEVGSPNRDRYQPPSYVQGANFRDRPISRDLTISPGTVDSALARQRSILHA